MSENKTFEHFALRDSLDNTPKREIYLHLIPFYILLIPLFIRLLLYICKGKIIKKKLYQLSLSSLTDIDKSKDVGRSRKSSEFESDVENKCKRQ